MKRKQGRFVAYILAFLMVFSSMAVSPIVVFGAETDTAMIAADQFGNEYILVTSFTPLEQEVLAGDMVNLIDLEVSLADLENQVLLYSYEILHDGMIVGGNPFPKEEIPILEVPVLDKEDLPPPEELPDLPEIGNNGDNEDLDEGDLPINDNDDIDDIDYIDDNDDIDDIDYINDIDDNEYPGEDYDEDYLDVVDEGYLEDGYSSEGYGGYPIDDDTYDFEYGQSMPELDGFFAEKLITYPGAYFESVRFLMLGDHLPGVIDYYPSQQLVNPFSSYNIYHTIQNIQLEDAGDYSVVIHYVVDGIERVLEIGPFLLVVEMGEPEESDRYDGSDEYDMQDDDEIYPLDLPQLATPIITLDGSRLFWDVDSNTTGMSIYVDNNFQTNTWPGNPFFDLRFLHPNPGTYQIQLRAWDWEGNFAMSELSGPVTFISDGSSPPQFEAPVISIDGHTLSWTLIEHAQNYGVYVDGILRLWLDTSGNFDLRQLNLPNGVFEIQLRTSSSDGIAHSSEFSNIAIYAQALPQLTTPVIALDGSRLFWDVDENTNNIRLYVNGNDLTWLDLFDPFYDLRFLRRYPGTYQIQIRSRDLSGDFSISELSEPVTFISDGSGPQQFEAPVISIDGHTLTWTLIEHAQTYVIYVNGVEAWWFGASDNLDLRQLNLPNGVFEIQLRTAGRHNIAHASELSDTVIYEQAQIQPPVLSLDGAILTWVADAAAASSFRLYVNGNFYTSFWDWDVPFLDLRFLTFVPGTYQIQLRSWDSWDWSQSELSEAVTFVHDGSQPPQFAAPSNLVVDGHTLTWTLIEHAQNYVVYVNGVEAQWLGASGNFDLRQINLPNGVFEIQLRTTGRFGVAYASELSNTVIFAQNLPQLTTPIITIEGTILTFDDLDPNSDEFRIYVDGLPFATWFIWNLVEFSFDLRHLHRQLGTFNIQVRAISWSVEYAESELSDPAIFINEAQLTTPVITLEDSILTWDVDINASIIRLYVDGDFWTWSSPHNPFFDLRFLHLSPGTYQIQVRAFDWEWVYGFEMSSELSNTVTFVADGSGPLQFDAPDISIDGHILTWTMIENAHFYSIYVDGMVWGTYSASGSGTTTHDLRSLWLPDGTFEIQLRTNSIFGIANGSVLSNIVIYEPHLVQFPPPVIALDGDILTWVVAPHTGWLQIYVDGNPSRFIGDVPQSYDLRLLELDPGTYQINLRAWDPWDESASVLSDAVTFIADGSEPPRVPAPVISLNGPILTWERIDGVNMYLIYVNGVHVDAHWVGDSNTPSYDLRWLLGTGSGPFQIQLRADGILGMYAPSEFSNVIEFRTGLLGDISGNGTIAPFDATLVAKYAVDIDIEPFLAPGWTIENARASMKVTQGSVELWEVRGLDAVAIAQYLIGAIPSLPCFNR